MNIIDSQNLCNLKYLPPTKEVCEGHVLTGVYMSTWGCLPHPLGTHPQAHTHPPTQCMMGYAQQPGGMHPNGMHYCALIKFQCLTPDFGSMEFPVCW